MVAGVTRLELAASCVTGKRSNQLNYTPVYHFFWWAMQGLNLRLQPCKGCTLPTELIAQKQRGYNNKQKWCQALNTQIILFPHNLKKAKILHTAPCNTCILMVYLSAILKYNATITR